MLTPLWRCAECGRTFANKNQSHFCGSRTPLDSHFLKRPPAVRALFDEFASEVKACGRFTVISEKTRIAFHLRMSFISMMVRNDHLAIGFVFGERIDSPRFDKIESYSPRNHWHRLRLRSGEIDDEVRSWIRAAYAVGQQRHLHSA
jgi:hypothetical protein